jgi:arylsulfatase
MIASWPGRIAPGSKNEHISAFWDVMPTMADIVGNKTPLDTDGISFLPSMTGNKNDQEIHEFLYWEFPSYGGQQAVRMGDWKGVRRDIFKGNMEIELYNLASDIREEDNVAAANPQVVEKIRVIMKNEHTPATIERFRMEALGDPVIASNND